MELDFVIRLAVAGLLGALIGLRENSGRRKPV